MTMASQHPNQYQDWLYLAKERASDADAIYKARPTSIGCVYMAGYAIECSLKALLRDRNVGFPKHGNEGHNLRGLWEAAKFRLSDLHDSKGAKTFFIESWDTSLRYQLSLDSSISIAELLDGAKQLTRQIQQQLRRQSRRQGR